MPDYLAQLAALERRYDAGIPRHLLAPITSKASPTELALAEERSYVEFLRRSLTYPSLTVLERHSACRAIVRSLARIAELEKAP